MSILILVIPLLLLWLLVVRPQQRRVRDQQSLHMNAGFGDEVSTAGGFIGTIVDVHDPDNEQNDLEADEIMVALAEGFEVKMLRRGVAQIRTKWDGEYDDGTVDQAYADSPIDNVPEAGDSPVDGD